MEVLGCLPDELLARASSRQLAELQAYYSIKHEERLAAEAAAQAEAKRNARRR